MQFLGYPIGEWSILLGLIITISGLMIRWLGKKAKQFVGDVLAEFKSSTINPLIKSIDDLSDSFGKESTWVHDRHSEVVERLKKHDETLEKHDGRLDEIDKKDVAQDQQIKTLFNNKNGGNNNE